MSARSYHNYHTSSTVQSLNRYHHLYTDVERPTVDLRLNYSPPPPSYSHADVLRVVSLDLTSPGRHSVDLSLRPNPLHIHPIGNTRLLADHGLQTNRILADHNRLGLDQTRFGKCRFHFQSEILTTVFCDTCSTNVILECLLASSSLLSALNKICIKMFLNR